MCSVFRSEVVNNNLDEAQQLPSSFAVMVDAANTPNQLNTLLTNLREAGALRVFTIFGCDGEELSELRPLMGAVAHKLSDYVIMTNSSPRREDPAGTPTVCA